MNIKRFNSIQFNGAGISITIFRTDRVNTGQFNSAQYNGSRITEIVFDFVSNISSLIARVTEKTKCFQFVITPKAIPGRVLNLTTIYISLKATKAIFARRLFIIKETLTKSFAIHRIFEFTTKILPLLILGRILNLIFKVSMSFTTSAKYIYLYWRKQLNPDIIGFKVLQSNSPYGTYTQIATTTDTHYIRAIVGGAKWIKVIPYTSRGDLKYVLFKGAKYG